MSVPEFDTWVPYVKNNVPRPVVLLVLVAALGLGFTYARDQMLNAGFYFGLIVAGNVLLWYGEMWTAKRDAAARSAGVATRGWGCDPDKNWSLRDRMRVDAELREKAKK